MSNTFLCCYCGKQINGKKFSLIRHEKIHQKTIKKIKCAFETCESTFKEKSDYYRHWQKKHKHISVDRLLYIEEQPKPYRLKKNTNIKKEVSSSNSNEICMLDYTPINKVDTKLQVPLAEPFFGELHWQLEDSD